MKGRKKLTLDQRIRRFWQQVDKSPHPQGCWLWVGARMANGYGTVCWDNRHQSTHRLSYEWHHGPIPKGLIVMHSCDNRACVNPSHLSAGTRQENVDDMVRKGRNRIFRNEDHRLHKLSNDQIEEIRVRYKNGGVLQRELADEYGIHYSAVSLIVNGKRRAA
jgi:hypothetical protein